MYHELELHGRDLCQAGPGYARYVVREADFRAQLALLADGGFRGLSVSSALTEPGAAGPVVVFTFDDGCETDLLSAAPLLKERGYEATFFLVAGFLGRRGYLSKQQARELVGWKFEIGCHSMSHAYLSGLDSARLQVEIADAKDMLEQVSGQRMEHFSCPGGRWSPEVARVARLAGYRSVSTSRIGANTPHSDPYCLNRVAVLRDLPGFSEICHGTGLGVLRLKQSLRSAVRSFVGDSAYERLRGALLR